MFAKKRNAFSTVELLIVISLIALLMAILLPGLSAARLQARRVVCKSNLRQLYLANAGYAMENDSYYVPAAPDIIAEKGGKIRWHGQRGSTDELFDAAKGPLAAYLAGGKVKQCPQKIKFVQDQDWNTNFEQGCGGYGYNYTYIGSRNWQQRRFATLEQLEFAGWQTTKANEIGRPTDTLMFADTAMSNLKNRLIEYSFAEPPFVVCNGLLLTGLYMSPSIHFRHGDQANVNWADGHIDSRQMTEFDGNNVYGVNSAQMKLGWFDPVDNTPFDLE